MKVDCMLYIPFTFNFKTIDGLILVLNKTIKGACLISIQITITKEYLMLDVFFANWNRWIVGLDEYQVKVNFLWIIEEQLILKKKDDKNFLSQITLIPKCNIEYITITNLDKDISNKLEKAYKKRKY